VPDVPRVIVVYPSREQTLVAVHNAVPARQLQHIGPGDVWVGVNEGPALERGQYRFEPIAHVNR